MKKSATLIITAIISIFLIMAVLVIESKSKTPMDRYMETSQPTGSSRSIIESSYTPKEIISNGNNLKYEFLSYELIDDKDIAKQTKYRAEYFIDGKVPPADFIVEYIDHDAMARDYPKYDEFRKSDSENKKGMTYEEADDFVREHAAEYRSYKHVKTKYLFVRCRITYTGNGRNEEWLSNFNVFAMRGNKVVGMSSPNCYFDHSQHTTGEERENEFFIYKFDNVGDSIECVLGCRLREDRIKLSEGTVYYIGFQPSVSYSDEDQFNPAVDRKCVALADIPKES